MNNQSFNTNYKIANVSKDEEKAIKNRGRIKKYN